MAIAFVQKAQNSGAPVTTSTFTVAYGSNNSAGGLLVAVYRGANRQAGLAGDVTFSDLQSNGWIGLQNFAEAATNNFQVAYAPNAKAGANTVTLTLNHIGGTVGWAAIDVIILEYSGIATSSPVDQSSAVATGTGQFGQSGNPVTTVGASDLIFYAGANSNIGPTGPIVPGAGFNLRQDSTVNLFAMDRLNVAPGTYTPSNDYGVAGVNWETFTSAFLGQTGAYSQPDCRVAPFGPNAGRTVQGTIIYDKQTSSNAAVPGTDSRVSPNIPADSRVSPNIPQNSRTPGVFGPGS